MLTAASCHTESDIAKAGELDLDFAVLGPVESTPTHPQSAPIKWQGFAASIARTRLPVYALGGLLADDLAVAIDHGAQGVALRRGAWPHT